MVFLHHVLLWVSLEQHGTKQAAVFPLQTSQNLAPEAEWFPCSLGLFSCRGITGRVPTIREYFPLHNQLIGGMGGREGGMGDILLGWEPSLTVWDTCCLSASASCYLTTHFLLRQGRADCQLIASLRTRVSQGATF